MLNQKKFTSFCLTALLVCTLFAGCAAKKEAAGEWSSPVWDLTSSEPEYLTQWPGNAFTEKIVPPQSGTVDYVLDDTASGRYAVFIRDISSEECEKYLKALKDSGYGEMDSDANGVSAGTILEREDAYLSVSYAEGILGVLITLKETEKETK